MKEDFESVKAQVRIEDVARHLLGEPVRGMYRYPDERTASIKIYPNSQTFYDFGRGTGGDCIRLWSYICHVNNWTALLQIKSMYGIGDVQNRENTKERIRQQEKAREAAQRAEMERKAAWRDEVDFWKCISRACDRVTQSSEPFSDNWCWAINQKQIAEYRLDFLCGVV